MRIYLTKTCAGPQGSFLGGHEYAVPGQVPQALSDNLVAAGYAVVREVAAPVPTPAPIEPEAAVEAPAPENAAERTKAPRGKRGRSGGA